MPCDARQWPISDDNFLSVCAASDEVRAHPVAMADIFSIKIFARFAFRQKQPEDKGGERGYAGGRQKGGLTPRPSAMTPVAVVPTAAAMPVQVPTAPRAKLNLPVPVVISVITNTVITVTMAPTITSNVWAAMTKNGLWLIAKSAPLIGSKPKPISRIGLRPHCSA
jgi:hypothetical protein